MGRIFIFLFFILALEQGLKAQETWEWVVKPIWEYDNITISKTDFASNIFLIKAETSDTINQKNTDAFIVDINGIIINSLNKYDSIGYNYPANDYLDEFDSFKEGMCLVNRGSHWGYVNHIGELVIPCVYNKASNFYHGYALVLRNDTLYLIDKRGVTKYYSNKNVNEDIDVLAYQALESDNLHEHLHIVSSSFTEYCTQIEMSLKNKRFYQKKQYDFITSPAINGNYIVVKNMLFGVITTNNDIIIPLVYEELSDDHNGIILAKKEGKYGFLDTLGQVLSPFLYDYIEGWRTESFYSGGPNVVFPIPSIYPIDRFFADDYPITPLIVGQWYNYKFIKVAHKNKYGLINEKAKVVIPIEFDNIEYTYDEMKKDYSFFAVKKGSKWGIIRIKTNTPSSCFPQITFSKPTPVEVSNSSQQNPYEVGKNEKLSLLFQIEGCQNIASNKIEIWVDGKAAKLSPLQTKTGSAPLPSQNMIFEEELSLLEGEHKIEIHYENAVSKTLYVKVAKKERRLYVLAIAPTVGLKWNEKDAKDFAMMFESQRKGKLYDSVTITVITGKNSTESELKKGIAKIILGIKKQMNNDDIFMMFVSSHGIIYEEDLRILTSDYDASIPKESTLSLGFIEDKLKDLSCKKILFIDACYSGVATVVMKSPSKDSLWRRLENSPNGITYFASSASNQQSTEANAFQNGVFTEALLRGIGEMKADVNKDNLISTSELANYLKITVPLLVKEVAPTLPNPQEPTVPKNTNTDIPIYQQ